MLFKSSLYGVVRLVCNQHFQTEYRTETQSQKRRKQINLNCTTASKNEDFLSYICGGTQKLQELLKIIYLKYLYKFETLAHFEVLPLRLDAAIPAPLPMLETLSKIFKEMLSRAASKSLTALDERRYKSFRPDQLLS